MAIQINSRVKFADGNPPDIGEVLNFWTSPITGEVLCAVHFARFPVPGGLPGWTYQDSSGRVAGYHALAALVEVGD
jgi:hypothetical protein